MGEYKCNYCSTDWLTTFETNDGSFSLTIYHEDQDIELDVLLNKQDAQSLLNELKEFLK